MSSSPVAASVHIATLSKIFKPSAPTDDLDLFRGRARQLDSVTSATQEEGQHAIIFGERGVGKTSLAYMGLQVAQVDSPATMALRLACGVEDDFGSVWRKLVPRMQFTLDTRDEEYRSILQPSLDRVEDLFLDDPTPELVARALNLISARVPLVVVVDEFDRIDGYRHSSQFADLLKQLSDDLIAATILIVGVADDVSELLAGHASIDRSLRQIAMPRMTQDELREIVIKGFEAFSERSGFEVEVDDDAATAIAQLSQGFPYYTHLLASTLGKELIHGDGHQVTLELVVAALIRAADEAEPSIKNAYHQATMASRSDARFQETLLACALAKVDVQGFFTSSSVRPPLEGIMGVSRSNASFNAHLKRFANEEPLILEVRPYKNSHRYRFRNPLMRPFVMMNGFATGLLDHDLLGSSLGTPADGTGQ